MGASECLPQGQPRRQPLVWALPGLSISTGSGQVSPDGEMEFGPGSSRAFPRPPEPGTPGDGFAVSLWEEGFGDSPDPWGGAEPPAAHPRDRVSALCPQDWKTVPAGCDPCCGTSQPFSRSCSRGKQKLSSAGIRGWLCPCRMQELGLFLSLQDAGAAGADEVGRLPSPAQQQHHQAVSESSRSCCSEQGFLLLPPGMWARCPGRGAGSGCCPGSCQAQPRSLLGWFTWGFNCPGFASWSGSSRIYLSWTFSCELLRHFFTLFSAFSLCCPALTAAHCPGEGDAFSFWMKISAKPSIHC